jgi:hypothetical protein
MIAQSLGVYAGMQGDDLHNVSALKPLAFNLSPFPFIKTQNSLIGL